MRKLSPATLAGLIAGLLFYANALIPYSHAWPLLWPVAGGVLAVVLASRRRGPSPSALGVGAHAGAVAGAVFLVLTVPTLLLLEKDSFASVDRALGGNGPLVVTGTMLVTIAAVAAGAVLIAMLGALLARAFVRPHAAA